MRRPGRLFYFRLASTLGCTVEELTRRLTLAELREWQAYDQIEPFGLGRLSLMAAAALRMQVRNPSEFDLTDFVPYYHQPPPQPASELTDAQQEAMERRMREFFKARAGV